ncbi:MAG: S41 family peptidase [Myxococcota bacterium]
MPDTPGPASRSPWRRPSMWVLLLAVGTGALAIASTHAVADREANAYASLDRFAQVLTDIERHYVQEVDEERLIDAAIDGMMNELDPHSRWLDERAYADLRADTEGQYEGIGVEVRTVPGGVRVLRVRPGGPAARDGLLAEDLISAVDGTPIAGMQLAEVSRLLRGPRGTPVRLTVQRGSLPDAVQIRTLRDRIDIIPVQAGILPGNIAYVRLVGFQTDCARRLERAIRQQQRLGATAGVVLDLRDNPGGLLTEAVAIVDLFVDSGPIVSTRGRTEGEQMHTASRGGFGTELPLVVLVNGESASASEVVTGALQDLDRATIIGTRTYGKGSVQSLFRRDRGALKLTIARYYTPAGTPVAAETGRVPDLVVPYPAPDDPLASLRARIDALEIAEDQRREVKALIDGLPLQEPEPVLLAWDAPLPARLQTDPQLKAALAEVTKAAR